MDQLYFHGFKVWRYLKDDAIMRLQEWLGAGMCYNMSTLAMLTLKHNKTARLCRGAYYDENGVFRTLHGWVEFRIPLCGWCVADFSWIHGGFAKKKVYFKSVEGEMLKAIWSCSYKDFWDLPFSNVLYKSMQDRKTSCILAELAEFGLPIIEEDGFSEWCYSGQSLKRTDGTFMIPFHLGEKLVSSRIMRDFVKNPKRHQPRAKSIRIAHLYEREYQK